MLARGHKLRVGLEGMVGDVAARGEPRITPEAGEDPHYFDNPDLPGTRSEMALPLKIRERVIGVLDLQSPQPGAFMEQDLDILQILADQIALAIDHALGLKAGSGLWVVKYLIASRQWTVDMAKKISPDKPLLHTRMIVAQADQGHPA